MLLLAVLLFHFLQPEDKVEAFISPQPDNVIFIEKEVIKERYLFPYSQHIAHFSQVYGIRQELIHCILAHEGGYKPGTVDYNWDATNPTSTATGAAQIIEGTWKRWRTQMGESTDLSLRTDPYETIYTTAWALAHGRASEWQVVQMGLCH